MRNEISAAELYLASKNLRRYSGALEFDSAMKIPHFSLYSVPYILMISDEFILKQLNCRFCIIDRICGNKSLLLLLLLSVLRIRDVYPGSRIRLFSILDPGSELSPSRISIKEFKYFNPPKNQKDGF